MTTIILALVYVAGWLLTARLFVRYVARRWGRLGLTASRWTHEDAIMAIITATFWLSCLPFILGLLYRLDHPAKPRRPLFSTWFEKDRT